MIYKIVKVEEENLYVKVAEKIKVLTDLREAPTEEEVFGRVLGYRYGMAEGQYFTAGGFENNLYKDEEDNIYFELPEELIKDVFTWMRDGSLICVGKGNPDWNESAPHGAGRRCSRSEAKRLFSVEEYDRAMKEAGVYSTSVNYSTLDECPMAYKDKEDIFQYIQETAEIVKVLKPLYNFKANSSSVRRKEREDTP